jgi:hypothetical protein
MAFLGQTFNANDVEPSSSSFEVLPAGKYQAQIVNSEMRDTKTGSGQYLWLELAITDGPHANKRLFDRLNLVNPNDKAVEIAQRTLSAICHATGQMQVQDSEQLHNRAMIVNVKVRPAGPDKSGTHREAANEIGGYEAVSAHRPAIPQQSAQPQQASAPQSAKPASTPPWRRTAA